MQSGKAVFVFILIVFMLFLGGIPPAHAAAPAIDGSNANILSNTTIITVAGVPGTSNDVVAVFFEFRGPSATLVSAVTDNLADTYTLQKKASITCTACAGSNPLLETDLWTTTESGAGPLTVSVSFTQTVLTVGEQVITILNLNTAVPPITNSGTCDSAGTGCGPTVSVPSTAFNTPVLLLAGAGGVGIGTLTAGTGYTAIQFAAGDAFKAESSTTVTSPTTFAFSGAGAGNDYFEVAAVFGSQATVFVTVPCTFFELQCWWYPFFMAGIYSGFVVMVGAMGRASIKGVTYLFLASLTFVSLIEVMMGMLNVMFPIILTLLSIVYAVRYR